MRAVMDATRWLRESDSREDQAAIAIDNAPLYEKTQSSRRQAQRLANITHLGRTLGSARLLARTGSISTPFLFFDEGEILRVLSYFERYLPEVTLFYAAKANPHPLLLGYLARRGLSFDVSSAQELDLVSRLGVSGSRIIFTNPIKGTKCLHSLFSHELRGYTFDNIAELEKIAEFKRQHGYSSTSDLFLRVRVKSTRVQIDLNQKFGCDPQDAPLLIKRASDLGLRPAGLSFHVGTQSYLAENFAAGIQTSTLVAETVRDMYGLNLSVIDIGGGFPDPSLAHRHEVSLDSLFSEIGAICRRAIRAGFTLFAEPGRILVSSAGCLVTSVIGLAERSDRRWLYLDDGVYGCYSGRSFDRRDFRFHPIPGPQRRVPFSEEAVPFVIAGPTCDALDVVAESALLPADIKVGDFVCSPNIGAYSLATASNFNGFGIPAAGFVSKPETGRPRTITVMEDNDKIRKLTLTIASSNLESSGARGGRCEANG
jgi:ornithine decarboxylase